MGDVNQVLFLEKHLDQFEGPILEVGSKDYGSGQDLRSLFEGKGEYLGVDLEPGAGVDFVLDLARPFEEIDRKLGGARFATILCLSVLEHCEQPFRMAENLTRLLEPGGRLCVGVPFAWKFHGYPSDYWRFTHEGVKKLFGGLTFDDHEGVAATSRPGDLAPLDRHIARISFSTGHHFRERRYVRGLVAKSLHLLSRVGPLRWLCGYSYVLAPTNVLMIGRKAAPCK